VLPGSVELLLKGVYAKYDGSGAATPYVPLLRLISDAGSTAFEIPADNTIAAGASADVTWFPGVAGGTSQSATAPGATAYLWGVFSPQTIPNNSSTRVRWDHFQTNDTTIFGTETSAGSGPPFHNTAGDSVLGFTGFGSYYCSGRVEYAAFAHPQRALLLNEGSQWVLDDLGGNNTNPEDTFATNTDAFGVAGQLTPFPRALYYLDSTTTPGAVSLVCTQTSGSAQALIDVALGVVYGDGGSGDLTQVY
jgi:hypothetical protein